jgi:23S rRNA (cytosine1962-C5)-methyltransferase
MMNKLSTAPQTHILIPSDWEDYALLDSGDGLKLERYGAYTFIRPEPQAVWKPFLDKRDWNTAHASFIPSREESGGHWQFHRSINPSWTMRYKDLHFIAQTTPGRHLGVFPEQASHWDWITEQIKTAGRTVRVLNLFGYTGLASLAAARAGAMVTHVDASKKAVQWARQNQSLSGLDGSSIRWIVDDAVKYIEREIRRGVRYDGILLDPPKFGRGPKGEVWEFFDLFPRLIQACRDVFSPNPIFIVITAYAIRASALSLYNGLQEIVPGAKGIASCGELTIEENSGHRLISMAIYARWSLHG